MKTNFIFLLIMFSLASIVRGQDLIGIEGKSPYPQGVMVEFTGFEGFSKTDLGGIRTTPGGEIDYFTEYHGYCMMSSEGMTAYPIILQYDPVCLEWSDTPQFPCDPENEFYYSFLREYDHFDSLHTMFLAETDSLLKDSLFRILQTGLDPVKNKLSEAESLDAVVYLKAEILLRESLLVMDGAGLAGTKENMLDFIRKHFDVLYHSDYTIKLAGAYLAMNRAVFSSRISMNQAMEYDVDTWVKELGDQFGEREVVDFFLIHFALMEEREIVANLMEKYGELVKCELFVSSKTRPAGMPYSFNIYGGKDFQRVYSLDSFVGISKVLAMYSTDCPASVAAMTGLYQLVSENHVRMPIIMLPDTDPEGELAELMKQSAPFGLQSGVIFGSAIISGAGVKQLPAFMILDRNNLQQEIIYDFGALKLFLTGDKEE